MNSFKNMIMGRSHSLLHFICFLVFLCFPTFALIQEYLGLMGISIYVFVVGIMLIVMFLFWKEIHNFIENRYILLVGILVVGLVVIFAVIYPLETAGKFSKGGDRDEALNIAVHSLIKGDYPYYEKTQFGNKFSPLPGAIFLSVPFVAIGNSAYQNLFWLLIYLYVTSKYLKSKASALILLITALLISPAVQYEFISGGDMLANSIYVIVFLFFTINTYSKSNSSIVLKLISSMALGIGLASRPNFFLLLPLIFILLIRIANLKMAISCMVIVCFFACVVIVPFYIYDPISFTPLTIGNKFSRFNNLIPLASFGVIVASIGLSIISSLILLRRTETNLIPIFFWMCAITQFFPIFCGVLIDSIIKGNIDFSFMHDRYGLMFLFFGLLGCWPYLSISANILER